MLRVPAEQVSSLAVPAERLVEFGFLKQQFSAAPVAPLDLCPCPDRCFQARTHSDDASAFLGMSFLLMGEGRFRGPGFGSGQEEMSMQLMKPVKFLLSQQLGYIL